MCDHLVYVTIWSSDVGSVVAESVFVGTEASSLGGQVRGWSVEEAGDSSWHR